MPKHGLGRSLVFCTSISPASVENSSRTMKTCRQNQATDGIWSPEVLGSLWEREDLEASLASSGEAPTSSIKRTYLVVGTDNSLRARTRSVEELLDILKYGTYRDQQFGDQKEQLTLSCSSEGGSTRRLSPGITALAGVVLLGAFEGLAHWRSTIISFKRFPWLFFRYLCLVPRWIQAGVPLSKVTQPQRCRRTAARFLPCESLYVN